MVKPSARSRASFVALLFGAATFTSAHVTATTDPVGFTATTLLGSSDTFVSIPFTRPPEFVGGISFGGPGSANDKLAKSKALAEKAINRL